jgi:hypothetical protein
VGKQPLESLQGRIVGDWLVTYTLETQDGYPVVSELRVVPCPSTVRADTLKFRADTHKLAEELGLAAGNDDLHVPLPTLRRVHRGDIEPGEAPPGGLSGRLLRTLQPSAVQEFTQTTLSRVSDPVARLYGYDPAGEPRHRGARHDDRFYATIAADYVRALAAGSRHPVVDVADAHHYDAEYVRDVLHDARQRELLTRPPRGRAGGQLTEKALSVLNPN